MFEKIPCEHCGRYYAHSSNCLYWSTTGIAEKLVFAEVNRRYDNKLYEAENDVIVKQKEIERLKEKISKLKFQRDSFEKAVHAWMDDYDRLKDKYEPEELKESTDGV